MYFASNSELDIPNKNGPSKNCPLALGFREWALILCIALVPAWGAAQDVHFRPASRSYMSSTVYVENGALHIEGPQGSVQQMATGWHPTGIPVGHLIALVRETKAGTELLIVDDTGKQVGTWGIPPARVPIVSDKGVITLVETLHNVVRPHDLGFYTLNGALLREVNEPDLSLVKWFPASDGSMVTVNQGPASDDRAIIVYAADGRVMWRYSWKGNGVPDVAMSSDGQRLVLLNQDVLAGTADLSVLVPGNQVLQTHHLPNLNKMVVSEDSRHIAAVGQNCAVLIDLRSGKLVWRKDVNFDLVLTDGLRFEPSTGRLLVIAAKRDWDAGTSRLTLRSLDMNDGTPATADLGEVPIQQAIKVLDVGMTSGGDRRVGLNDRIVDVPLEH